MKLREIELHYREGSSDKVYKVRIDQDKIDNKYYVNCDYGRRGSYLRETNKGVFYEFDDAEREFYKVVKSKTAKGYSIVGDVSYTEKEVPYPHPHAVEPVEEPIEKETVLVCEEGDREKALARLRAASAW